MEVGYIRVKLTRVIDSLDLNKINKNTLILTLVLILIIALIQTFQNVQKWIQMVARGKQKIWAKLTLSTSADLLCESDPNSCVTSVVRIRAYNKNNEIGNWNPCFEDICEEIMESWSKRYETGNRNPGFDGTAIMEKIKYEIVNVSRPLLVFVNAKSGGQNGNSLRRKLNLLLNPIQVMELSSSRGPEMGLEIFKNIKNLKILVCGGDGTVTWVLQAIEKIHRRRPPPVSILPLGTGNDLSRVLNWGGGVSSALENGGIAKLIEDVNRAEISKLDRWNVTIKEDFGADLKFMTNYLSVGCDAKVAYQFHLAREEKPHLFCNQFMNKVIYAKEGGKDMIERSCDDLPWYVNLQVDGKIVEIPEDTEGLLVLNIPSYMGGVDLWQNKNIIINNNEENFDLQSMNDKTLEVVCVTGTLHLGKIQFGLSRAKRVAQGRSIRIDLRRSFPVQVDGEPWIQSPGSLQITHRSQVSMLKRPIE